MNRLFFVLLFLCISIFTACNDDSKNKIIVTETTIIDLLPQDSLQVKRSSDSLTIVHSLLADVSSRINRDIVLGRIAEQKTSNTLVKNFSKMIQKDHKIIKNEFEKLAAVKNFLLPVSLTSAHQLVTDEYKTMQEPGFDKAYMNRMIENLQDNISILQKESEFPDTEVKLFAQKTIPYLRKHLEQAKAIVVKL